mgnify:CR=1 FL=1
MPSTNLPALAELDRILQLAGDRVEVRVMHQVASESGALPVYAIAMGNPSPEVPAIGFFGGVHGLERIGTEVVLAFLASLVQRMAWDHTLHQQLQTMRMVFMPLVNPGGMLRGTRANPAGVDLMRNAPIDALEPVPAWVGGQRVSAKLPWYRGALAAPMQPEAQALCDVVESELTHRAFSISIDCHSGFGVRDRLWFPYAHTRQPITHLAEMYVLQRMYRQWPFFRTLLSNMDMVLAKSDLALASRYAELVSDSRLRKKIFTAIEAEWHRTADALALITGEKNRLESNPALARSIRHRFPYIDPLHHLQVELIRRYREGKADERVQRGIHISINGIAAGLRNTG